MHQREADGRRHSERYSRVMRPIRWNLRIAVSSLMVLAVTILVPGIGLAISVTRENLDDGCVTLAAVTGGLPRTWSDERGDHCTSDSFDDKHWQIDCENGVCVGEGPSPGRSEFRSLCKQYRGAFSDIDDGYKCYADSADGTTWQGVCQAEMCRGTTRKFAS
jgi:hypothetical protein